MNSSADNLLNLIKSQFLNSVLVKSQMIYKSFLKGFSLGAELNKQISLENYNDKIMGFGYRALEDIGKGEEIMRIPVTAGFHGKELKHFTNDEHKVIVREMCEKSAQFFHQNQNISYQKLFQTQVLTMQVLLNFYNENAELNDFVNSFPFNDLTNINFWSQKTFENISSRNLKTLVIDNRNVQEILYSIISEKSMYDIRKDDFFWAYNNVNARKISFLDNPITSNEEIEMAVNNINNKKTKFDYSNQVYQMLLPLIDYFNHSFEPNCRLEPIYDQQDDKSYVICISECGIKKDDQLFINYGNESNATFLVKYGFCINDNPNHETYISFFEQLEEEGNSTPKFISTAQDNFLLNDLINSEINYKNTLLERLNIDFNNVVDYNLRLFPNKLDINILKILRILLLNNEANFSKDSAFNHDFSKMYSKNNEVLIHQYLLNTLNYHYRFINDKDYSEKIEQIGKIDSKEKLDTMNLYIMEREEQILLRKNIDYLNRKINEINNL